jgi:hypothetical protein
MNGQSAIKSPKHAALPAQAKVKNVLDDRIYPQPAIFQ